jgi:hypothetical protein
MMQEIIYYLQNYLLSAQQSMAGTLMTHGERPG